MVVVGRVGRDALMYALRALKRRHRLLETRTGLLESLGLRHVYAVLGVQHCLVTT